MPSTTTHPLSPLTLEEICSTLRPALKANYGESTIDIVTCPDLTASPFRLASPGLCGNESIADIGGQAHLFPRPLKEKKYSLVDCAKSMGMSEQRGLLIGAGAAPWHVIGQNAELTPNMSWEGSMDEEENVRNETFVTRVESRRGRVRCERLPSMECALMMNLYGCEGVAGDVLKVTAKGRRGQQGSFTECLRQALRAEYGEERQVSLGGVFVIKKGKAVFHVMPDFPPEEALPFASRDAVSEWLTFHRFAAPMVCLSMLHSADPEKLGLRMEHTHCFSTDKDEGGHYHYDVLSDGNEDEEIEYEAYFNTAKVIYRIDMPS